MSTISFPDLVLWRGCPIIFKDYFAPFSFSVVKRSHGFRIQREMNLDHMQCMTWFSNSLICLLHILGKMLRCAIRYGHSCFDWSLGIVSWKFPHFPLCCLWFDWSCCPLAENKKSFWAFLLIGGKTHSSPLCNSQSVFHVNPDCLRTFDCVK